MQPAGLPPLRRPAACESPRRQHTSPHLVSAVPLPPCSAPEQVPALGRALERIFPDIKAGRSTA